MIWRTSEHARRSAAIHQHVISEITAACGEHPLPPEQVNEVAHAVEAYWSEFPSDVSLPSDYVKLMVARALAGAGEGDAARRLAMATAKDEEGRGAVEAFLEFTHLPPEVWLLFASGLVRPSRWMMAGVDWVWVLDLSRLTIGQGDRTELAVLQALRAVMRTVAEVWDVSKGRGVLGLKELRATAMRLAVPADSARAVERWTGVVRTYCGDLLGALQSERGWETRPELVVLDVGVRG